MKLKKIKVLAVVGILSMFMVGCQAIKTPIDENYHFGDTTKSVIKVQAKYCSEADPVQRALMLTAIRASIPSFPSSGACTELYKFFGEDSVEGIANEVDLEQALADQKKYQNK